MTDLQSYRRIVDRLLIERNQAEGFVERESAELEHIEERIVAVNEAVEITQKVAQAIQQRVHLSIARVVTRCLGAVFDDPYDFQIRFDRKRGRTEAVLLFVRGGIELDEPMEEVGGGVIDVAAFALRLACVMLSRPRSRKTLILDEPLKNVRGVENRRRVRGMLLELAERMEFQFVLNVDADAYPEFALGKIVELP